MSDGIDEMYANCRTTALQGAKRGAHKARSATRQWVTLREPPVRGRTFRIRSTPRPAGRAMREASWAGGAANLSHPAYTMSTAT